MFKESIRKRAIRLRRQGKTFTDIQGILKAEIPKSTLSHWFHNLVLSESMREKIEGLRKIGLEKARKASITVRSAKRAVYLGSLLTKNKKLSEVLKNKDVAKIALALLYLGEGSKSLERGSLVFGNSSPDVIKLFLYLLRYSYDIDENKFRCTVQCRADQDTKSLEIFWASTTNISPKQFYQTRIDPRTIGKISNRLQYKGVCRIDYFSAHIFNDLLKVIEVICKGH